MTTEKELKALKLKVKLFKIWVSETFDYLYGELAKADKLKRELKRKLG